MTTNFPDTGLDTLTNPTATDAVATVDHAAQHANANDAIEALEAKVGVDSSAVTTSHDYKLSTITSTDKAVGVSATQTLTNKTLTTPVIASLKPSAGNTQTVPDATSTLVDLASTQTLTGKTIDPADGQNTIDGDKLEISWTPTNYTPTDVTETDDAGQLSAHLKGVDDALAGVGGATTTSMIPTPAVGYFTSADQNFGSTPGASTNMTFGRYVVPFKITVNKIIFRCTAHTTASTVKIAVFSEDGQTKHIEVTSASVAGTGTIITAVSPAVELSAGVYYIGILYTATGSFNVATYEFTSTNTIITPDTGEPYYGVYQNVTADTVPAVVNLTSGTVFDEIPQIRFD